MHVTLKFIGDVPAEKLDPIRAALADARSGAPVEIRFRGVGFFPNERRPRVLWCGIEASANLAELAASVEGAVEPVGIAREGRAFQPHVTLARFASSPQGIDKLIRYVQEMSSLDFGSARETEFHLYESALKPSGAEYKKLESFAFVKGTA
jgi:2'-5' RNA ligase